MHWNAVVVKLVQAFGRDVNKAGSLEAKAKAKNLKAKTKAKAKSLKAKAKARSLKSKTE